MMDFLFGPLLLGHPFCDFCAAQRDASEIPICSHFRILRLYYPKSFRESVRVLSSLSNEVEQWTAAREAEPEVDS